MADETRRSLGPLSWAALEALVTDAHPSEDGGVVNTSVRQLAAHLGVAKNTAHRALVTLRDAGFLEPHQSRSTSGQFAAGAYRLTVAPSILRPVAEPVAPSGPAHAVRSRAARRAPSPSRQLSLLPSV
jgi:DNA-binding transcriptional MocR family regulator